MKAIFFAAVLAMSSASFAQVQTNMQTQPQTPMNADINGPNIPPGDGITRMGTNPEGQPFTPPGFNQGMNVYPAATMAPGAMPGMVEYLRCSRQVTDRCVQAYAMAGRDKARRARSR